MPSTIFDPALEELDAELRGQKPAPRPLNIVAPAQATTQTRVRAPQASVVKPLDPALEEMDAELRGVQAAQLKDVGYATRFESPDEAALVHRLASENGLPLDVVKRNLAEVQGVKRVEDLNYDKLLREYPATASLLGDPQLAPVARADVHGLSSLEWLLGRWDSTKAGNPPPEGGPKALEEPEPVGALQKAWKRGETRLTGVDLWREAQQAKDPATQAQVYEKIQKHEAEQQKLQDSPRTWLERRASEVLSSTVEQLPMMGAVWGRGAVGAAKGGLLFGLGTLATGAGAPLALPAAGTGALLGGEMEKWKASREYEAAGAFPDLLQRGVPWEKALKYADLYGMAAASVEGLGDVAAGGVFALGGQTMKRLLSLAGGKEVMEALAKPTIKGVLAKAATPLAIAGMGNYAEEFTQQHLQTMVTHKATGGGYFDPLTSAEWGLNFQSGYGGLLGGLAFGGPVSVGMIAEGAIRIKQSEHQQQVFRALNDATKDSETRARSPETIQKLAEAAVKNGAPPMVYADAEAVQTFLQERNTTPAQIDAVIPGFSDSLAKSGENDGYVAIPMEAWTTHIAGKAMGMALVDDVTVSLDIPTPRESREMKQLISDPELHARAAEVLAAATEKQDTPATRIFADFQAMAEGAGVSKSEASKAAALTSAFYTTLGERHGLDPEQAWARRKLQIQGVAGETAAPGDAQYDQTGKLVLNDEGKPLRVFRSNALLAALSGETASPESTENGLRGNAELLRQLLVGPAFRSQGFSGLDAPMQRVVLNSVLSFGHDQKILRSVVEALPVDMVDSLKGQQFSPESLLRDETMLRDFLSTHTDEAIAFFVHIADSVNKALPLADSVAGMTTERPSTSGEMLGSPLAGAKKGDATAGADEGYLSVSVHGPSVLRFISDVKGFNKGTLEQTPVARTFEDFTALAENAVNTRNLSVLADQLGPTLTEAEVPVLQSLEKEARAASNTARKAKDFNETNRQAALAQFYREAVETGAGGKTLFQTDPFPTDMPLPKGAPKKLYRGESAPGQGSGVFMLGKGLYSTTTKKLAAEYGKATEVDPLVAYPRNPLVLRSRDAFMDWALETSGLKNAREFNTKFADPAEFVRAQGFDGIVAGDVVVRYPSEGKTYKQAPIWYSKLDEAAQKGPAKAKVSDWLKFLEGKQVPKAEIEWRMAGLDPAALMTKGEVQAHLAANEVRVEEVRKGEGLGIPWKPRADGKQGSEAISLAAGTYRTGENLNGWYAEFEHSNGSVDPLFDEDEQEFFATEEEARNVAAALGFLSPEEDFGTATNTKFGAYKTPGGENYREVLLTLPGNEYRGGHWDEPGVLAHVRLQDFTAVVPDTVQAQAGKAGADRLAAQAKVLTDLVESPAFQAEGLRGLQVEDRKAVEAGVFSAARDPKVLRGIVPLIPVDVMDQLVRAELTPEQFLSDKAMLSHALSGDPKAAVRFSEPAAATVFVRSTARLVAEEAGRSSEAVRLPIQGGVAPGALDVGGSHKTQRILLIEEIQSDMHQQGRKKGYGTPPAAFTVIDQNGNQRGQFETKAEAEEYLKNAPVFVDREASTIREVPGVFEGVPDAPFKGTDRGGWVDLALKRILRMAAEEGYDRVAWTPGEMQAERYDLSKQISRITYEDNSTGGMGRPKLEGEPSRGTLTAWGLSGDKVLDQYVRNPADIENYIGKEAAQKLLEAQPVAGQSAGIGVRRRSLEGLDLKVGGEGMKGFYDKIVPAAVSRLTKQYGVKVGETTLAEAQESKRVKAENSIRRQTGEPLVEARGTKVPAFDVTPALKEAALNRGFSLFQNRQNEARGAITFGNAGTVIKLFETANKSTLIHELGHLFLEEYTQAAADPEAPQSLKDELAKIRAHLGAAEGQAFTDAQHETFARSFEAYLFEGKAPSVELVGVFDQFKAWLLTVYRYVANLHVDMNPEIKGIFDRMLASDAQIAEAEAYHTTYDELKGDLTAAWKLTEDEQKRLQERREKAKSQTRRTRESRLLAAYVKALGGKAEFAAQAKQELDANPVYRAMDELAAGQGLAASDLDWLVGEEQRKALSKRRPGLVSLEGGQAPETVAAAHGFATPAEMVAQMLAAPAKASYIKERVVELTKQAEADILRATQDPAAVPADEDWHNDERLKLLLETIALVQAKQGQPEKLRAAGIRAKALREVARQKLSTLPVAEASAFSRFSAQELRARKKATSLQAAGKTADALVWMRNEALAHAMVLEAIRVRDEAAAGEKYLGKFDASTPKSVPQEYRDQIMMLLRAGGFAPGATPEDLTKLATWLHERELHNANPENDALDMPDIDPRLFQPWTATNPRGRTGAPDPRQMPVDLFQAYVDAVKSLEHIGRAEGQLLAGEKRAAVQAVVDACVEVADRQPKQKKSTSPGAKPGGLLKGISYLRRIENFFYTQMDGGTPLGPWLTHFIEPFAQASATKADVLKPVVEAIEAAAVERLGKQGTDVFALGALRRLAGEQGAEVVLSPWYKKQSYPELGGATLSKVEVLCMALNMGNELNISRMEEGFEGWTREDIVHVIEKTLSLEELRFVQACWDAINLFWPHIEQVHEKATGVKPEKVVAQPITFHGEEFAGGYYPITYNPHQGSNVFGDPAAGSRTAKLDAKKTLQEAMGGNALSASTRKGHTERRQQFGGGQQPLLDLSVLWQHLDNVSHDIAYRLPVRDANKLLAQKDIIRAIHNVGGEPMFKEVKQWVHDVANDYRDSHTLAFWESFFLHSRAGLVTVAMGWNLAIGMDALADFSLFTSPTSIGPFYLAKGAKAFWAGMNEENRSATLEAALAKSAVLREIKDNWNRDVLDATKKSLAGKKRDRLHLFGFAGMVEAHVATVGWLGAYQKGLDTFNGDDEKAVRYADMEVRRTIGTGKVQDMAHVMRPGHPLARLFTMFFGWMNKLSNLLMDAKALRARGKLSNWGVMGVFVSTVLMPAILAEVLRGRYRRPDGDEDKESWKKFAAKKATRDTALLFPGMVPGVRDAVNAFTRMRYGKVEYEMTPASRPIEASLQLLHEASKATDKWIEDDPDWLGEIKPKDVLDVSGYWLGLPSGQIWKTSTAVLDGIASDEITPNMVLNTFLGAPPGTRRNR